MNITEIAQNGLHTITRQLVAESMPATEAAHLSAAEKIRQIENKFREIMLVLGLDLNDDSLKDTPLRVAKMYVNETFGGLLLENEPAITLFDNKYNYREMLIERNIPVYSCCEHHFVPIIGKAHIAYISAGKVIGLSKLNRVVHYFSKRPQVQERLTIQIAEYLKEALGTQDVAIVINAEHLCVASRGVRDVGSSTITASYNGLFLDMDKRKEFNAHINS
jgi:GTP cyclohydrolase I